MNDVDAKYLKEVEEGRLSDYYVPCTVLGSRDSSEQNRPDCC